MSLKDDRRRLIATNYSIRFEQRLLYSDMDGYRHLNNGATGRFLEEGRATFNIMLYGVNSMIEPPQGEQILFASLTMDFIRQAHYPGIVEIATSVSRIGNTSFVLAQAAFQNDACFALADAVMVKSVDGSPTPLGDDDRRAMAALMLVG